MTRILIVDDELVCRESLGALLSLQGFEVRTAADGSEATELGKIFPPTCSWWIACSAEAWKALKWLRFSGRPILTCAS